MNVDPDHDLDSWEQPMSIYEQWIEAKSEEAIATKRRREIEDKLVKQLSIPENLEGTKNINADQYLTYLSTNYAEFQQKFRLISLERLGL